ncbi:MAG TPA: ribosome maturation factor RimM [Bryobacteraceae bacterium]|jgi:16S rRNA processing protein RimM|nr:ribosome maturation factor RimM [Bryobacteraceae bacterium]
MQPEKVVLAEILRTRGVSGEVVARSQTDVSGRLESLKNAQVDFADGSSVPVEIVTAWPHKGHWVLKFSGVDSIEAAARFRGGDLWVPYVNRGTLSNGDFFQSDLIGCRVIDAANDEIVGAVEGWQQYGGAPLMEVRAGKRELLIPFVRPLCDVDLKAKTIRMELPEGLLEL